MGTGTETGKLIAPSTGMRIGGHNVGTLLKRVINEGWRDNILTLSASTAYALFFSLFPILLFLAPLLSLVGNKTRMISFITQRIAPFIPSEAITLVNSVLKEVVFAEGAPGVMSVGAIMALYAGSNVFGALSGALNTAYGVSDDRPWWKQKLLAVAYALGAVIVVSFSTTIMIAGGDIADYLAKTYVIGHTAAAAWKVVQYPVAIALITIFFALIYYYLPAAPKQRMSHVIISALFAVILWILVTLVFRLYVQNFGSYNKTYGTIGAVIVLLAWMYWSMIAVLLGGELAAELREPEKKG